MATILKRKLSAKTIMGARPKPPEERTFLFRIAGRVTGIKTGASDFGPWVAFKGAFQAERADGELFTAPVAFVPEPVQSMLEDAINQQMADGLVPSLQFGLDVFIVPDETAATGYQYEAVPILKPQDESDSLLAELNKQFSLPKPDTAEPVKSTPAKTAAKKATAKK